MHTKRNTRDAGADGPGEVWDLAKVAENQRAAARATLRLLDMPGLPPFVSEAVYVILDHAAKVKDVALADDSPAGYSVKALANLYALTSGFQRGLSFEPTPEPTPEPDLAALISAVLNHPDTPSRIYNGLSEAVGEYTVRDAVQNCAEVIRIALNMEGESDG
jgi:hypothetical protein